MIELNSYEQVLYNALNLYVQYPKKTFNSCLFSKFGFYIGLLIGIILGVYITKVIAILICDFKLEIFKLFFISLGVLIGVGGFIFLSASSGSAIGWMLCKCLNISRRVNSKSQEKFKAAIVDTNAKNLPSWLVKKDFRDTKLNCYKKYSLYYYSITKTK